MWPWPPEDLDDRMDDYVDEDGVTCKFCGTSYLVWEEVRGEHNRKVWALTNPFNGEIHDCRKRIDPNTEFEEVCDEP